MRQLYKFGALVSMSHIDEEGLQHIVDITDLPINSKEVTSIRLNSKPVGNIPENFHGFQIRASGYDEIEVINAIGGLAIKLQQEYGQNESRLSE